MSSTAAPQLTTPQRPAVPRVVRRPSHVTIRTHLWHSAAWNSSNSSVPPKRTAHLNGPEASILGPASDLLAAGSPFTGLLGLDSNMAALCSPGRRRRVYALDTALCPGQRISLVSSETVQDVVHRASGLACRHAACWHAACRHARWRVVVFASRRVDRMVNGTRVVSDRSRLSRAESATFGP